MLLRININGQRAKNRLALIHLLKIRGIPYALETDSSIIIETPSANPNNRNGINWIDMKAFFALSPKAKQNKSKPGWHLRVPIQPNIDELKHSLSPVSQQHIADLAPGETVTIPDLANLIPHLTESNDYTNQITEAKNDLAPTLFRTVSNNSPANSWVTIDRPNNPDYEEASTGNIKTIDLEDSNSVIINSPDENIINNANPLLSKNSENMLNEELNEFMNNPDISSKDINEIKGRNTPDFYEPRQLKLF